MNTLPSYELFFGPTAKELPRPEVVAAGLEWAGPEQHIHKDHIYHVPGLERYVVRYYPYETKPYQSLDEAIADAEVGYKHMGQLAALGVGRMIVPDHRLFVAFLDMDRRDNEHAISGYGLVTVTRRLPLPHRALTQHSPFGWGPMATLQDYHAWADETGARVRLTDIGYGQFSEVHGKRMAVLHDIDYALDRWTDVQRQMHDVEMTEWFVAMRRGSSE